jgi:hypothetical protein
MGLPTVHQLISPGKAPRRLQIPSLPSHRTADCIFSLFCNITNNVEEVNPYHLPVSLLDE